MTVEQIKQELESLSFDEKGQLTAYLVHLRNRHDPEYGQEIQRRIGDTD